MDICFDTEFTGLHKDTTLISIGLVNEYGESFYAEFNDYNKSQCEGNNFLEKEVIGNLFFNNTKSHFESNGFNVLMKGSKEEISDKLKLWLSRYDSIQFISDVSHYDFVLLVDLLAGDALSLPKNISAVCHDINHDIAFYFNLTDQKAFDYNREEILTDYFEIPDNQMPKLKKHNSLYDAKIIQMIFNKIRMY